MLIHVIEFYHFMPFWVALAGESQDHHKERPVGFISSHTFQRIRMKFEMLLKQLSLASWYFFWLRFGGTKEMTAVLLAVSKDHKICMHLDVYKLIWFKHDMMIDTVELNISILVSVTSAFIQSSRDMRKQKLLFQLSLKVCYQFGWNLVCCWELLVWWTTYSFYVIWPIFKGENPSCVVSS